MCYDALGLVYRIASLLVLRDVNRLNMANSLRRLKTSKKTDAFLTCRRSTYGRFFSSSSYLAATASSDVSRESPCTGRYRLHPPLSFITITKPESWYSITVANS